MIVLPSDVVLTIFILFSLLAPSSQSEALLTIRPSAFLPDVTQSVQMTCSPAPGQVVNEVLVSLEVLKQSAQNLTSVPVASYVIAHHPAVETLGAHLGASASGSYDPAHPEEACLSVTLPQPTNEADGQYSCVMHALDDSGLLQISHDMASLVSLAQNGSVPDFYQALLKELRNDLDNLNSDLVTVQISQDAFNATNADAATILSAISSSQDNITQSLSGVNVQLNVIDMANASLQSQLENLRQLTPETPVSFYAHMTNAYLSYIDGATVIFNVWSQHTDSSYSTSTGIFTAPVNGTYFFRTALTWDPGYYSYASITVKGIPVASLFAYDDYGNPQASASAVVALSAGDTVYVVKKAGQKVYGLYNHLDHVSYFMGILLW